MGDARRLCPRVRLLSFAWRYDRAGEAIVPCPPLPAAATPPLPRFLSRLEDMRVVHVRFDRPTLDHGPSPRRVAAHGVL